MSDSDEAAFESADEGDVGTGNSPPASLKEKTEEKLQHDPKTSKVTATTVKPGEKGQGDTKSPAATGTTPPKQSNQKGKKGKKKKGKQKGNKEKAQDESDDKEELKEDTSVNEITKPAQTITEEASESSSPQETVDKEETEVEETKEKDAQNKCEEKETEAIKDTEKEAENEPNNKESDSEKKEGDVSDQQAKVLERLSNVAEQQNSGWGSWSSWGSSWGSKLVSTASNSVSTFTSQVGEGLSTVLDSVESSLGAMSPEDIAKLQEEQVKKAKESAPVKDQPNSESIDRGNNAEGEEDLAAETDENVKSDIPKTDSTTSVEKLEDKGASGGWFSSVAGLGISSITSVVQETSKHLVDGSIDVLEQIGKKTYEVVAEGDHGLRNTIKNTGAKPNLSVILREAKEQAEHRAKEEEEFVEARKAHFGAMFDEYQGLVQLEALEMLSNQCEGRVQGLLTSLPTETLKETKPELIAIKESFEFQEDEDEDDDEKDHDFKSLVGDGILDLGLNANPEKLIQVQEKIRNWLSKCKEEQEKGEQKEAKEIHVSAIQALAEITARSIEQYHKLGQLFLVDPSSPLIAYKEKSATLLKVSKTLCTEVGILSTRYTQCLNTAADDSEDPDSVTPLITNVYLEATNSTTYIQDAFQLLLPVVQQAALEAQAKNSS